MNEMGGHMLHGVESVTVADVAVGYFSTDEITYMRIPCDGRVYMWGNGAFTIYSEDPSKPWVIYPAYRVVSIRGKEHG